MIRMKCPSLDKETKATEDGGQTGERTLEIMTRDIDVGNGEQAKNPGKLNAPISRAAISRTPVSLPANQPSESQPLKIWAPPPKSPPAATSPGSVDGDPPLAAARSDWSSAGVLKP